MQSLLPLIVLILCFVYGFIEEFFVLRPLNWKLLEYIQEHYPDVALNLEWFNFKPLKGIPNKLEIIIFSFWDKYHIKDSEISNLRYLIRKSVIRFIMVILISMLLIWILLYFTR